jgi:hypothetical protein
MGLDARRPRPMSRAMLGGKHGNGEMSTKQERAGLITHLAFKMAESGKYPNYQHIEAALRADGHDDARSVLDDRAMRGLLNEICKSKRDNVDAPRS